MSEPGFGEMIQIKKMILKNLLNPVILPNPGSDDRFDSIRKSQIVFRNAARRMGGERHAHFAIAMQENIRMMILRFGMGSNRIDE